MKSPNKRWSPKDKRKAYKLISGFPFMLLMACLIGIVGTCIIWVWEWDRRKGVAVEMKHENDIQIISTLIQESNPSFDPVYVRATAEYIASNCGIYDPVFITVIGYYEGSWKQTAQSSKGAEGFFQIKPQGEEKQLSKAQRLFLEYQLEKAIERLDEFYEKHQSIYKMHFGYVGAVKNKHIADNYIAKIYTKYAEVRGFIWKGGVAPIIEVEEKGEEATQKEKS